MVIFCMLGFRFWDVLKMHFCVHECVMCLVFSSSILSVGNCFLINFNFTEMQSNLPNITHVTSISARDIKEVCSVNLDA